MEDADAANPGIAQHGGHRTPGIGEIRGTRRVAAMRPLRREILRASSLLPIARRRSQHTPSRRREKRRAARRLGEHARKERGKPRPSAAKAASSEERDVTVLHFRSDAAARFAVGHDDRDEPVMKSCDRGFKLDLGHAAKYASSATRGSGYGKDG